ncbi:MAG: TlpA family protein disulfide reductase [Gammaproteobacteria bacterium]
MSSIQHILKLAIAVGLTAWTITADAATPTLNLDDYKGKVVYLDFWASWCAPCMQSFPWMDAMQEKYGSQGLVIIAVNENKQKQNANKFLKKAPVNFKIIYDPTGILLKRYGVSGLPTSFLINPGGDIYRRHLGFSNSSSGEYEREIRRLLDK